MIFKIICIALVTIISTIIVKQYKPEFAFVIPLVGGFIVFSLMLDPLQSIISAFSNFGVLNDLVKGSIRPVCKIIGIGFLTEFSTSFAEDAGLKSVAVKLLWAGKICILLISLPMLEQLFQLIIDLL